MIRFAIVSLLALLTGCCGPEPNSSTYSAPLANFYSGAIDLLGRDDVAWQDKMRLVSILQECDDDKVLDPLIDHADDARTFQRKPRPDSGTESPPEVVSVGQICVGILDDLFGRIPRQPFPIRDYRLWRKEHPKATLDEARELVTQFREQHK